MSQYTPRHMAAQPRRGRHVVPAVVVGLGLVLASPQLGFAEELGDATVAAVAATEEAGGGRRLRI